MAARTAADWDRMLPEQAPARVIARLEAAREALGLNWTEFAERASITPQQYHNWRKGLGRLSVHHAVAICKAHHLTMDYICLGDLSGLPHSIHDGVAARLRISDRRNS